MDSKRLHTSLNQWRDSLINLSSRNKLLNYKKTRASTIEFSDISMSEIFERLISKTNTYIVGTKADTPRRNPGDQEEELEDLVIDDIQEFNYSVHKDSLFTSITQRDVDKTLKTIANAARREYLDKGISPLYLGLGALTWIDEADDIRTSPLVLVPVELVSSGPKEPLHISRSDDDISINPALALKLSDFGISLPSSEEIIDAIEAGGIVAALSLCSNLKINEGWSFNDFASLAVFAFQKEAMYRDLLDNEALVLENSVIRALGGGATPEESDFFFDPIEQNDIDQICPPETTSLVLDADSSQRAAVAAALAGHSFVLDGPPGTGKSQTIANIIGTLIDQGKSVLFVSEKIVALEVVKDRLHQRGLGAFLFELHSHKATRKEVAKQLGSALRQKPVAPPGMPSADLAKAEQLRTRLNQYAEAMNQIREPLNVSLFAVLGTLEKLNVHLATPTPDYDISGLIPSELDRIQDAVARLGKHWALHLEGETTEWFGIQDRGELAFRIDSAITALTNLENNYAPIRTAATELRMSGTFNGPNLSEILEHWASGEEFHDENWLSTQNQALQQRTIRKLNEFQIELAASEKKCDGFLGSGWKSIALTEAPKDYRAFTALNSTLKNWRQTPAQSVQGQLGALNELIDFMALERRELAEFTSLWGISSAQAFTDLEKFRVALSILRSAELPPIGWITKSKNRKRAKEAFESLKAQVSKLKSAELQAISFTRGVVDLDLEAMSDFFEVNRGFFNSLSKAYRVRKHELSSFSKAKNWNATLAALPAAISWKKEIANLVKVEFKHSQALAPLYASLDTDWDAIALTLRHAEQILSAFEVIHVDRFENAIESKSAKQALADRILGLDSISTSWSYWSQAQNSQLFSRLESLTLAALASQLETIQGELAEIVSSVEAYGATLPEGSTLESLIFGLAEAWSYSTRVEAMARTCKDHSAVLSVEITLEKIRSADFRLLLDRKMAWTREMRKLVNAGSQGIDLPLSSSQFQALSSSELPKPLRESSKSWLSNWSTLRGAFSADLHRELDQKVGEFASAHTFLSSLKSSLPKVESWFDLKRSVKTLNDFGLARAVESATEQELGAPLASNFVLKSVLSHWVSHQLATDERLGEDPTFDRSDFVDTFRALDINLKENAVSQIIRNGLSRRPRSAQGQAGVIEREAEKKTRHIPVRDLINRSRDVIQGLHPCFMMSPMAVSQYLPSDIRFDVVIFDEASQVTPADAINCVYRGSALISAGDQKQLPPMSFFATSGLEDDSLEDDAAGDYDSILDLMKASGSFNSMTLNWHYRSRHEHLIAYSNFAFYESRLITFPGAVAESDDLGVKFFKVNGTYRRSGGSDNPVEAKEVALRVINHFDTRPGQSLGVVAFSTSQRDAIENAVELARRTRPDLEKYFQGSRQDGFFVNSLEAVQGDERDVIIFSIGYGPDESGKIYKNFGPLNRAGGERRLNVAITRARKLVEIVSSMTSSELGDVNNEGARHLRKYLDFAERGPIALQMELGEQGLGTDSPFEDSVIAAIRSWGYEVQPQVGVAGYRIDIGVKHPSNLGAFILGVECDGAMYHSSRAARDRDRLRHEILEGLGWKVHHIWGTAWYRHRDRELDRLKRVIEEQAVKQVSGRLVIEKIKEVSSVVDISYEDNDSEELESWTEEYEIAKSAALPANLDLSDPASAKKLADFFKNVVLVEQPIHRDLLLKRLRASSNIDKVGSRILKTVERALALAKIEVQDDFLWASKARQVKVRRCGPSEVRTISQISVFELRAAIKGAVRQATGISKEGLIQSISKIYGWKRTGSQIELQVLVEIDYLINGEVLTESIGGLRIT